MHKTILFFLLFIINFQAFGQSKGLIFKQEFLPQSVVQGKKDFDPLKISENVMEDSLKSKEPQPQQLQIDESQVCTGKEDALAVFDPVIAFHKKKTCISERKEPSKLGSNQAVIEADKEVCDCLAGNQKDGTYSEITDEKKRHDLNFAAIEQQANQMMTNLKTTYMFNLSSLGNNDEEAKQWMVAYQDTEKIELTDKVTGFFTKIGKSMIDFVAKSKQERQKEKAAKESLSKSANEINFSVFKQELKPGQCISIAEYQSFNQLPRDNIFYQDIASLSFKEEDWDYNALKKRLSDLSVAYYRDPSNEEVKKIKARMVFLQNNPMIKNLFLIKPEDYKSKGNKEITDLSLSDKPLKMSEYQAKKKQQIFDAIKKSFTPSDDSCLSVEGKCLSQVIPNSEGFKKALRESFNHLAIADLMNSAILRDKDERKNKIMASLDLDTPDYYLPKDHRNLVNMAAMVSEGKSVGECYGDSPSLTCFDAFVNYCPLLYQSYRTDSDGAYDLGEEVDQSFALHFNDQLNQDYIKFNNDVCQKARVSKDGKQYKTYAEFSKEFCKQARPECEAENRQHLVSKFIEEYPAQTHISSESDKLLASSFSAFNKNSKIIKVSEKTQSLLADNKASATMRSQIISSSSNSGGAIFQDVQQQAIERRRSVTPISNPQKPLTEQVQPQVATSNSEKSQTGTNSSQSFAQLSNLNPSAIANMLAPEVKKAVEDVTAKKQENDTRISQVQEKFAAAPAQSAEQTMLGQELKGLKADNDKLKKALDELRNRESRIADTKVEAKFPKPEIPSDNINRSIASTNEALSGNDTTYSSAGGPQPAKISNPSFAQSAAASASAQRARATYTDKNGKINEALLAAAAFRSEQNNTDAKVVLADPVDKIFINDLEKVATPELTLIVSESEFSNEKMLLEKIQQLNGNSIKSDKVVTLKVLSGNEQEEPRIIFAQMQTNGVVKLQLQERKPQERTATYRSLLGNFKRLTTP